MIHLKCKTDVALILLGVANQKGFLIFPTTATETPGLMFSPGGAQPVNLQILSQVSDYLGLDLNGQAVEICQEYSDTVTLASGNEATLYLATIRDRPELIKEDWSNLPDHLRAMPKNKNRLAYLRAWQVLTGSLTLNTKVIEADDLKNL